MANIKYVEKEHGTGRRVIEQSLFDKSERLRRKKKDGTLPKRERS